jgi:hypothetical protein
MRQTRNGRGALAVAVISLALLAGAPSALAAAGTGKITGTVTKVGGTEPIEGIEVCAYELDSEPEHLPKHCAKTDTSGNYTISEIPGAEYEVEFSAPVESGLDYITQYYKDKSSFDTAEGFTVREGQNKEDINAELQVGGEISGTVTNTSKVGLQDIEVIAYQAGLGYPVADVKTDAHGKYTIAGLANGSYKVEFSPQFESGLNYVPQFYDDKSSFAAAEPVSVKTEETTEDIDVELQPGGTIEGTVTDASTNMALPNVEVEALGPNETFEGVAVTEANGHYTIIGLASGSYKVDFADIRYITQYYNNQPSFASANPVTVLDGSITQQIDAALLPVALANTGAKAPVNTVAPVLSGTPALGQALSCSTGTWAGSPKPSYSYSWLRDGAAIAGAVASTYTVQTADTGNRVACKVTATNKNGSAAAASNTLAIPLPAPVSTKPVVTLALSKLVVAGGSVRVPVTCAVATCSGTIELTEHVVVKRAKGKRKTSRRKTIVLAKGAYTLGAGHTTTVVVQLNSSGKSALAKAKHHRLSVELLASVFGGATAERPVLLGEPPAKHRKKSR